jgi:hypothetical protein
MLVGALAVALALVGEPATRPGSTERPLPPPRVEPTATVDAEGDDTRRFDPRVEAALRLVVGTEWDTNARRAVTGSTDLFGNTPFPTVVVGDALVRALVDVDVNLTLTRRDRVALSYLLGAKRFVEERTEDVLVHDLGLETVHGLVGPLHRYARGRVRASRMQSGLRDYTLGSGGAGLGWRVVDGLTISLGGRYDALGFGFDGALSYRGAVLEADVTWRPTPRLTLSAFGGPIERRFDGFAFVLRETDDGVEAVRCDGTDDACPRTLRSDLEGLVGLRATYRGPVVLGLDALGRFQGSTSEIERIDRYRIAAFITVALPLGVMGSALAALQFNKGVSATQGLYLVEDDENQNSIEVQLSRALVGPLDATLRYGLYANEFATAPARFLRQTFYLGLSYTR